MKKKIIITVFLLSFACLLISIYHQNDHQAVSSYFVDVEWLKGHLQVEKLKTLPCCQWDENLLGEIQKLHTYSFYTKLLTRDLIRPTLRLPTNLGRKSFIFFTVF